MDQHKNGPGQGCIVCLHPQAKQILEALEAGTPISYIPAQFNHDFSRATLHRHIKNCLQGSGRIFQERQRINLAEDVNNRLQLLLNEAEEALAAARDLLLVDGQLNFDPRAWEIKVVYSDENDTNRDGNPKQKTGTLDQLLARLEREGFVPKRVYVQSEDFRKSYREAIKVVDSLADRIGKFMGLYKPEQNNELHDQLQHLRAGIEYAARKMNKPYQAALAQFLEIYSSKIKPELVKELKLELAIGGMPEKECLS
jgi:hypothetical protein